MKRRIIVYSIFIFLVVLLQTTLADYIKIYNVKPNLILILVVSVALLRGNGEGAVIGFTTGLIMDMLFGRILGFFALLGMYLGLIIGSVNKRLYRENFLVVIFFTFVSTIAYEGAVYSLNAFMRGDVELLYPFTRIILPEAIYNSVVSILVYAIVIRMNKKFEELGKTARKY